MSHRQGDVAAAIAASWLRPLSSDRVVPASGVYLRIGVFAHSGSDRWYLERMGEVPRETRKDAVEVFDATSMSLEELSALLPGLRPPFDSPFVAMWIYGKPCLLATDAYANLFLQRWFGIPQWSPPLTKLG